MLQKHNDMLQTRVQQLETALAAAEDAKGLTDRQHQWEVQNLKRKVMELAVAHANSGNLNNGDADGSEAGNAAGSPNIGLQQQRKLLLVRQLEDMKKTHAKEVAVLQSKLRRYEEDALAD